MKLNNWLYGVMALGMLSACSSDDTPVKNPGTEPGGMLDGYLAVQINLPQEPSTRGVNDDFQDGESYEYAVNDATLVLFSGDNESSATFKAAYNLTNAFSNSTPDNDNITSTSIEAVQVSGDLGSGHLYALVLINKPQGIVADGATFTVNGSAVTTLASLQNAEFEGAFLAENDGSYSKFFMTNAPLSQNIGGKTDPSATPGIITLTDLGSVADAVKPTLQEAKDDPAGCIYVERAVAKVSAEFKPSLSLKGADGEKIANITASAEYALINTNTTSYVVRNIEDIPSDFAWNLINTENGNYRMIGSKGIPVIYNNSNHNTERELYRTYWCKDPNYADGITTKLTATIEESAFKALSKNLYCKENTFDVANQTYKNTTFAVFKVTYALDGMTDLYIINDNKKVVYTSEADVTSGAVAYILKQTEVKAALQAAYKDGAEIPEGTEFSKAIVITFEGTSTLTATAITLNPDAEGLKDYFDESSAQKFAEELAKNGAATRIIDEVNGNWTITKYAGGVSYYKVPIMHFGQDYTPWTAGSESQVTPDKAYGTGADAVAKYLGRYGVVRNNWYELTVNSLTGLGDPEIPTVTDDLSDDNNEVLKYIGIETHMMSWAKRTQGVDF